MVAEIADRVVVMNAGEIVGSGETAEVYRNAKPLYPQTDCRRAGQGVFHDPLPKVQPVLSVRDVVKITAASGRWTGLAST